MIFSEFTNRKVNWTRIEDSAVGLSQRGNVDDVLINERDDIRSPVDLTPVFEIARQEFQRVLSSLRLTVRILLFVAGVSVVVSLAGVIVAAVWQQVIGGVIFTGIGSGSLIMLFLRIQSIGRDQALLELVPTKYQLALQFASSNEDRRKLLDRFLDETASLRAKL